MKQNAPLPLLAVLMVLAVTACQKEPDEDLLPSAPPSCPISRIDYYDQGGGIADTAGFEYNGTNISRVKYSDYYIDVFYTGTRITRRSYYDYTQPGSSPLYDSFVYNGSGQLTAVESYLTDPGLPADYLYSRITFTYSGQQLTSVKQFADTAFSGTQALLYEYSYRYSGNNIDRCIAIYYESFETDTLSYQYDNQPNLFRGNTALLFTDNLFADLSGELMPFVFSTNNVTGLTQSGTNYGIGYQSNAGGQLTEMQIDGLPFSRYTYKCP